MDRYIAVRGNTPGPLFIQQANLPVNRASFVHFLNKCLVTSNLQVSRYNTHSFRIGRATQMAMDGHTNDQIKAAGRWKSSAFLKYIRPSYFTLPSWVNSPLIECCLSLQFLPEVDTRFCFPYFSLFGCHSQNFPRILFVMAPFGHPNLSCPANNLHKFYVYILYPYCVYLLYICIFVQ